MRGAALVLLALALAYSVRAQAINREQAAARPQAGATVC